LRPGTRPPARLRHNRAGRGGHRQGGAARDDRATGAAVSVVPERCPVDETPSDDRPPPNVTRDTRALPPDLAPAAAAEYPDVPGYEVLGVLGHGGMGVVYRARQLKANRLVALKMIRAVEHASPTERLRLQIEIEAVARLQHPHIVQLYEVGEVRGQPFF